MFAIGRFRIGADQSLILRFVVPMVEKYCHEAESIHIGSRRAPSRGIDFVQFIKGPTLVGAGLDFFAVEFAFGADILEVPKFFVIDPLVQVTVNANHLCERPVVEWLEWAPMTTDCAYKRHAISGKAERLQQPARGHL